MPETRNQQSKNNDIYLLIEEIRNENQQFRQEILDKMREFQESLQFHSNQLTEAINTNKKLQEELGQIKQQNAEILQENKNLETMVIDLKTEVTELQQYSRRFNLEINNLPETPNEKIDEVFSQIADKLNMDVSQHVSVIHRVATTKKDKIKPIIVQFNSLDMKNNFLKEAKSKQLTAQDFNSNLEPVPVYFNDHLCIEMKKLLYDCKQFKTEKNFKYCWIKGGKIFLRKLDGSKIYRIRCLSDIYKVPIE